MNTVSKGLFEKISRQKADIQFVDYLYEAGDVFYFGINNHVYGYSPDMEKSVFESYVRSIQDPMILMGFLVENAVLVDFERADFCPLMESLYIGKKTSLSESEDAEDLEGETEEDSESEESDEDDAFFSDEDEEESEYSQAYGAAYTEGFEDAVSGKENRYEAETEDKGSEGEESEDEDSEENSEIDTDDDDDDDEMEEGFVGSDQSSGGLGYGGLGEEQYPEEDLAVQPVYKESEEAESEVEPEDTEGDDFPDEDDSEESGEEEMSEAEMGTRDGYEDGYADGLIFNREIQDGEEEVEEIESDEEETEEEDAEEPVKESRKRPVQEAFEDDEFEDDEFEEEDDADDEAILGMLSEEEAIELFCAFVECDPYEIEASWEDERGDWHFVIDNQEYLVNQDREVLPQNGV